MISNEQIEINSMNDSFSTRMTMIDCNLITWSQTAIDHLREKNGCLEPLTITTGHNIRLKPFDYQFTLYVQQSCTIETNNSFQTDITGGCFDVVVGVVVVVMMQDEGCDHISTTECDLHISNDSIGSVHGELDDERAS
ncbi:hypothetical protein BLOT_014616 [Blomia tropicalis]|nr:hypothetical protein BLOT_014616 [Blomia tropicalis]